MPRIATLDGAAPPRQARQPWRRRATLAAAAAAAAAITAASTSTPASGQVLSGLVPTVTETLSQLLHLAPVSPAKLEMVEEEGYICFMTFHRVPPGISWVCVPPLQ